MDSYSQIYSLKRDMFRVCLRKKQISETLAQNRKHFYTPPDPIKLEMLDRMITQVESHTSPEELEVGLTMISKLLYEEQQSANVFCNILATHIDLFLRVAQVDEFASQSVLDLLTQIVFNDQQGSTKAMFESEPVYEFIKKNALDTKDNRSVELSSNLLVYLCELKPYRDIVIQDNFKFIEMCFKWDRFQQFTGITLQLLETVVHRVEVFDNPVIVSELFKHYFNQTPQNQILILIILGLIAEVGNLDLIKLLETPLFKHARESSFSNHSNALISIKFCAIIYGQIGKPLLSHINFYNTLLQKYHSNDNAQTDMRSVLYWSLNNLSQCRENVQFLIENQIIETVLNKAADEVNQALLEVSYLLFTIVNFGDAAQCSYFANHGLFEVIQELLKSENKEIMNNCTQTTTQFLKTLEESSSRQNDLVIELKQAKQMLSNTQIPKLVHGSSLIDSQLVDKFELYY